jgi:6-hydroxy-3-succinoylpyridine 3-monooxygenase
MGMPMTEAPTPTLRTRVYVDGYNFYYGCLKGTPYKWLDLVTLFDEQILRSQRFRRDGETYAAALMPLAVKYFTAKILTKAAKTDDSVECQKAYHNALQRKYPDRVELIEGRYALHEARAYIVDAEDVDRWPRHCEKITVWKIEEKQSDVALALQMYRDALRGEVEQVVLVSNDTDFSPALKLIREDTNVVVGLVIPTPAGVRDANTSLAKHAHWCRDHINASELAASQLPRVVAGKKRSSVKPESWYARPDLLQRVLQVAIPVRGGRSEAFKWLNAPNDRFAGRAPIELLDTEDEAQTVLDYMDAYIAQLAATAPGAADDHR